VPTAGVILLAFAALRMEPLRWGAVGIMSALGLATGFFSFPIDERTHASFGAAVFAASVALFGGLVAMWVVAITTVVLELVCVRGGFRRAAIETGAEIIGVYAAATAYTLVGGRLAPRGIGVADAIRFFVMFVTLGALSTAIRSVFSDSGAGALRRYLRWVGGRGVVTEIAMVPLSLLLVASYTPGEPATFPLLAVVLMVSGAAGKTLWDTKQSLLQRVEELRTLNKLGKELTSSLHLDVLVQLVQERAGAVVGASAVSVALYDEGTGELEYRVSFGPEGGVVSGQERLDSSLTAWVVKHREPLLVRDLGEEEWPPPLNARLKAEAERAGVRTRSWLGVPLLCGERLTGVLAVHGTERGAFSDQDRELLTTLAGQVARVIENARLYEGLERSRAAIENWSRTLEEKVRERTAELEKARAELEELNSSLEKRVEARTRELEEMQEKIVQSGRLAAVGELAAGIAHELNNPLCGILGYAQLDLERLMQVRGERIPAEEADRLIEHLGYVEREAERCREIVENLLRFGQSSRTAFTTVDVNAVLMETLDFTQAQLRVRGIEVETSLDREVPPIVGDPQELKQVFANIILNARNAMAAGGRLSVCTGIRSGSDGQPVVAVAFHDTGCGIRKEFLGRVFEPFFTTRSVGEGTGLGLSVSYGIVRDHGGDIRVESEVGQGSTFTVELPAAGSGLC